MGGGGGLRNQGSSPEDLSCLLLSRFQMSKTNRIPQTEDFQVSMADSFCNDIASLVAEVLWSSKGFRLILRTCFYAFFLDAP